MIRLHRAEGTFLRGSLTNTSDIDISSVDMRDKHFRGSTGADETDILPHQAGRGLRRLFLCTPEEMIKLEPIRPQLVPLKRIRRYVLVRLTSNSDVCIRQIGDRVKGKELKILINLHDPTDGICCDT